MSDTPVSATSPPVEIGDPGTAGAGIRRSSEPAVPAVRNVATTGAGAGAGTAGSGGGGGGGGGTASVNPSSADSSVSTTPATGSRALPISLTPQLKKTKSTGAESSPAAAGSGAGGPVSLGSRAMSTPNKFGSSRGSSRWRAVSALLANPTAANAAALSAAAAAAPAPPQPSLSATSPGKHWTFMRMVLANSKLKDLADAAKQAEAGAGTAGSTPVVVQPTPIPLSGAGGGGSSAALLAAAAAFSSHSHGAEHGQLRPRSNSGVAIASPSRTSPRPSLGATTGGATGTEAPVITLNPPDSQPSAASATGGGQPVVSVGSLSVGSSAAVSPTSTSPAAQRRRAGSMNAPPANNKSAAGILSTLNGMSEAEFEQLSKDYDREKKSGKSKSMSRATSRLLTSMMQARGSGASGTGTGSGAAAGDAATAPTAEGKRVSPPRSAAGSAGNTLTTGSAAGTAAALTNSMPRGSILLSESMSRAKRKLFDAAATARSQAARASVFGGQGLSLLPTPAAGGGVGRSPNSTLTPTAAAALSEAGTASGNSTLSGPLSASGAAGSAPPTAGAPSSTAAGTATGTAEAQPSGKASPPPLTSDPPRANSGLAVALEMTDEEDGFRSAQLDISSGQQQLASQAPVVHQPSDSAKFVIVSSAGDEHLTVSEAGTTTGTSGGSGTASTTDTIPHTHANTASPMAASTTNSLTASVVQRAVASQRRQAAVSTSLADQLAAKTEEANELSANLTMAAELGQQLVEEKEALEARNTELKTKLTEALRMIDEMDAELTSAKGARTGNEDGDDLFGGDSDDMFSGVGDDATASPDKRASPLPNIMSPGLNAQPTPGSTETPGSIALGAATPNSTGGSAVKATPASVGGSSGGGGGTARRQPTRSDFREQERRWQSRMNRLQARTTAIEQEKAELERELEELSEFSTKQIKELGNQIEIEKLQYVEYRSRQPSGVSILVLIDSFVACDVMVVGGIPLLVHCLV